MSNSTNSSSTGSGSTGSGSTGSGDAPAARSKHKRKAGEATAALPIEDRVIEAALALIAVNGWSRVTLADIAAAAGLSLVELHDQFPGKGAVLTAYSRRTDVRVLRAVDPEDQEGEKPKDRLFEVLMLRFDEIGQHKEAVRQLARDLRDPFDLLSGVKPALRSMHWMLEAAGIDSGGLLGAARARALAVIWLAAFRVWLSDGEGLAKTMAEMDRRLEQASFLWGRDEGTSARH
ncbi:MAG: helix-turn-helix domain-containing protein [Parvibaculum sp.]